MLNAKTGDLVAKMHPRQNIILQVGLVIEHDVKRYVVKWTWYHKKFFMEKKEKIFQELNKHYLLSTVSYERTKEEPLLVIVTDSYIYDDKPKISSPPKEDNKANCRQY